MTEAEKIEAKAAEWLIRRDAAAGEEMQDFTVWLASDPRHRAAYLRLAAAWERTAILSRLRPDGPGADPDLLSLRPKRGLRLWMALALAAGVALIAASATWWSARAHALVTYRTDIGGLSRVLLADGSAVTLNTNTEVRVRLSPTMREIQLVHGEAHFAVAHDVHRPFVVSAGVRVVRAVGTAFDVRLKPDQAVQVIVTEGLVAIETVPDSAADGAKSAATVSAGESAVADASDVTVRRVSTTEASRRLAWEVGELSFQGETLKEAVTEFNRYNHRMIIVEDPAIAQLEIGGNFNPLDVESFVQALESSFNVTAKTSDDGTVRLEAASPHK